MIAMMVAAAAAADLPDDHVAEVAAKAEMTPDEVRALLAGREPNAKVIKSISTPWERKPWDEYAAIFMTEERIAKGKAFRDTHRAILDRAEKAHGVPVEIIVSILGVETMYSERMGSIGVLDALFTLGFHYPKRGAFFRRELGHYLRLATDEGWELEATQGSYAGAMGMAQFIPSSYRNYSIDFDGDGTRDLFGSATDAIGSIGSYLQRHGWQAGAPILLEAEGAEASLADKTLALDSTVGALKAEGVALAGVPDDAKAEVYSFTIDGGAEYRVGLQNFYAITRYNRSKHYARAVADLGAAIGR